MRFMVPSLLFSAQQQKVRLRDNVTEEASWLNRNLNPSPTLRAKPYSGVAPVQHSCARPVLLPTCNQARLCHGIHHRTEASSSTGSWVLIECRCCLASAELRQERARGIMGRPCRWRRQQGRTTAIAPYPNLRPWAGWLLFRPLLAMWNCTCKSADADPSTPIGLPGAYRGQGENRCTELLLPPSRMQSYCTSLAVPALVRIGLPNHYTILALIETTHLMQHGVCSRPLYLYLFKGNLIVLSRGMEPGVGKVEPWLRTIPFRGLIWQAWHQNPQYQW